MKLIVATSLIVTTVMHSACAQSEFATPTGARVQGVVIECGSGIAASPCGGAGSPLGSRFVGDIGIRSRDIVAIYTCPCYYWQYHRHGEFGNYTISTDTS